MTRFTDRQSSHGTKGAVHGVMLALLGLCAGYNVLAYIARHREDPKTAETHLLVNGVVYTAGLIYECYQVRHHCQ